MKIGLNFLEVKIELLHWGIMPQKANPTDAGFDLFFPRHPDDNKDYSIYYDDITSIPDKLIVPLGFKLELPEGWCARIWPRSGWASKGIQVHPGIIDHLYRQEVGVIVYPSKYLVWKKQANDFVTEFEFKTGDKIAQMTFEKLPDIVLKKVDRVEPTQRGGFGSTGT